MDLISLCHTYIVFDLQKPVVKRIAVPKPNKVAGKSKTVEVIEISSDTVVPKQKKVVGQSKVGEVIDISSDSDEEHGLVVVQQKKITKKKATTYTSVLTARSKVNFICEMMI